MKYTYGGDTPATYPMYLDVTDPEQPKTLEAEPGQSYDVRPGEGYTVLNEAGERVPLKLPMPPDDRWSAAKAEAKKKENG